MFDYPKKYDVIVVGAGHAGIEAALASARMGCSTLMLTTNADTIGQMSCNPAIGGLAKGHLAREIDALGGEMGKCTDMTGLQFRMLNTSKGPSVWAPRAQCDKKAYQIRMKWICEKQANLDIKQESVMRLTHADRLVSGVETALGVRYAATCVVITTGTFLRGLMHIGNDKQSGGRAGEPSSNGLSDSLREVGLELGRLKTGTPPRLLRRSIDFSNLSTQAGDEPVPWFTFWKDELFHVEQMRNDATAHSKEPNNAYPPGSILAKIGGQLPCHLTHTTERTAELIRANLHKSPMYSGVIEGIGPRYCPSIEDKIVRFADKERHQVFLEPEGVQTDEIYMQGFSTCLPIDVQYDLVRSVNGCENAEILRPAYAVEYDFSFPTQLDLSLESKTCQNLFLGGQINGTSGYEEAGAQGLMAGVNAARKAQGKPPIILRRDQAYIGVLIDDLVTKGTAEPYRMFTSRAEFRLLLRQDNADQRISKIGNDIGLISVSNYKLFSEKTGAIQAEIERLNRTRYGTSTLEQLLRRPELTYNELPIKNESLSDEIIKQVEIMVKYSGYIDRQQSDVNRSKDLETKQIPVYYDYNLINGFRIEARQKLSEIRPSTIGQASRISGITPADISVLLIALKQHARNNQGSETALKAPLIDVDSDAGHTLHE